MGATEHDPRRWGASGTWTVEPAADAAARMPPFGRRFFAAVFEEFPALAARSAIAVRPAPNCRHTLRR